VLLLLFLLLACVEQDEHTQPGQPTKPAPSPSTSASSASSAAPSATEQQPGSQASRATARPMMIGFTRDYCLPCQVMKPWIAQLRREHVQWLDVVVINVDRTKNQRFAPLLGTRSVPTQLFIAPSGRIETRHEGVATLEEMKATFRRLGWTR